MLFTANSAFTHPRILSCLLCFILFTVVFLHRHHPCHHCHLQQQESHKDDVINLGHNKVQQGTADIYQP